MALTVGSLFSGIGGIDLGLERAGMVTRWFVEIDPHCRNVLARHWPGLPIYGDITAIDWSGVAPVDVLAGGFPCQPVSNAGKRLGTDDERWLWPEFARAVRALAPRYVFVENVAALLGRGFGEVITDMAALGYDAEWDCIPAAAVGAPHLRDRLWIVAVANSERDERTERREQQQTHFREALADAERRGSEPQRGTGGVASASRATQGEVGQRERGRDAARDRGEVVADASPRRRRAQERNVRPGQPNAARRSADVAHPAGIGEREQADEAHAIATAGRAWHEPGDGCEPLAHTDGHREPQPAWGGTEVGRRPGDRRWVLSDAHGEPLGRLAEPRRQRGEGQPEPGLGGHPDGLSTGLERHRWPAPPGPQHEWEPPRIARGVPQQRQRLKADGNAVVPQVVEWIGRRIVAFDEGRVAA